MHVRARACGRVFASQRVRALCAVPPPNLRDCDWFAVVLDGTGLFSPSLAADHAHAHPYTSARTQRMYATRNMQHAQHAGRVPAPTVPRPVRPAPRPPRRAVALRRRSRRRRFRRRRRGIITWALPRDDQGCRVWPVVSESEAETAAATVHGDNRVAHTSTQTHTEPYRRTYTQRHRQTHKETQRRTHTLSFSFTHTHTYTYTYAPARARTHTHFHTGCLPLQSSPMQISTVFAREYSHFLKPAKVNCESWLLGACSPQEVREAYLDSFNYS